MRDAETHDAIRGDALHQACQRLRRRVPPGLGRLFAVEWAWTDLRQQGPALRECLSVPIPGDHLARSRAAIHSQHQIAHQPLSSESESSEQGYRACWVAPSAA